MNKTIEKHIEWNGRRRVNRRVGVDTRTLRSSEFRQSFGGRNVSSIDVAVIVVVFKPIRRRTPSEIRESTKNAQITPGLRVFVIPRL